MTASGHLERQLKTYIWYQKWTQWPLITIKSCITLVYTLDWCPKSPKSFFSIWPLTKMLFFNVFFSLINETNIILQKYVFITIWLKYNSTNYMHPKLILNSSTICITWLNVIFYLKDSFFGELKLIFGFSTLLSIRIDEKILWSIFFTIKHYFSQGP